MDRAEMGKRLMSLSKASIIAAINAELIVRPDEMCIAALDAEWQTECAKGRAAREKALEYSREAERRAIAGNHAAARIAFAASATAYKEAEKHSRRAERLFGQMMALYETED